MAALYLGASPIAAAVPLNAFPTMAVTMTGLTGPSGPGCPGGYTGPAAGRTAQYNAAMDSASPATSTALRDLVDEYRHRCLWFLRRDYYPATIAEAERVLDAIQRHGDRDGFRRAARVRQWLSPPSSATSVGS